MEELIAQTKVQLIDFVAAWNTSNVDRRQELAQALFPSGLVFSPERLFFEPQNTSIFEMFSRSLEDEKNIGAGDGI